VPGRYDVDEQAAHHTVAEPEQALRLVVDEGDVSLGVGRHRALLDSVQDRLTLLEQRRDLIRLQAEGLPLHAAREQDRSGRAEQESESGWDQDHREDRDQRRADVALEHAHGDEADDPSLRVAQRHLRAYRPADAPGLGADELVSRENRPDRLTGIVGE